MTRAIPVSLLALLLAGCGAGQETATTSDPQPISEKTAIACIESKGLRAAKDDPAVLLVPPLPSDDVSRIVVASGPDRRGVPNVGGVGAAPGAWIRVLRTEAEAERAAARSRRAERRDRSSGHTEQEGRAVFTWLGGPSVLLKAKVANCLVPGLP